MSEVTELILDTEDLVYLAGKLNGFNKDTMCRRKDQELLILEQIKVLVDSMIAYRKAKLSRTSDG